MKWDKSVLKMTAVVAVERGLHPEEGICLPILKKYCLWES